MPAVALATRSETETRIVSAFQLPPAASQAGWRPIPFERACLLDDELQRELPAGHRLKGKAVHALAEREETGESLFCVGIPPNSREQFAVVELTGEVESERSRPPCHVYDSIDEWRSEGLGDGGVGVPV